MNHARASAVKVIWWCNQPAVRTGGRADASFIMPHQLEFTTEHDVFTPIKYPGFTIELPSLESKMRTSFRGRFALKDTPPYVGGSLRAAIFISDLHEPTGWRLAQRRELKLRCEPNFAPDTSSESEKPIKLLLVCSSSLCRAKFVAWEGVAKSLGLRVEVFPLTRCTPTAPASRSMRHRSQLLLCARLPTLHLTQSVPMTTRLSSPQTAISILKRGFRSSRSLILGST